MQGMTISEVSKRYRVSTRMLRYYEQFGLIESYRRENYAYRMYDEATLMRLRQIVILRKLRIPLKQIRVILQSPEAVTAVEVFRRNLAEIDEQITALTTIRSILSRFLEELNKTAQVSVHKLLTSDDALLASIESLSYANLNTMEDKTMDDLKKAEKSLEKLTDVRIIRLPPSAVASAHYIGEEPEAYVSEIIDKFVREYDLCRVKPDLRNYGFNHPNPSDESGAHGYEMWVTIPEDMEVPAPLTKRYFEGGLYAAHMIPMGNFHEWEWLLDWVKGHEKYDFAGDMSDQQHMCGLLEEQLNYVTHVNQGVNPEDLQLDLLMPIKER